MKHSKQCKLLSSPLAYCFLPQTMFLQEMLVFLALFSVVASSSSSSSSTAPSPPQAVLNSAPFSDAAALLGFKSKADLRNHLGFSQNASSHFCEWQGVTCYEKKVVRLILKNLDLGGVFASNTLSLLDHLRVLSLQNNSLTGPIPDLSRLLSLRTLFLDQNHFTGSFPLSILSFHRLRTLDLSSNNLSGPIPSSLNSLDSLYYLRLDSNRFNGTIPPLNQSSLKTFNVSGNNLTGAIPVTPTLLRFGLSSFSLNPGLCGEIIHKECHPRPHFFGPTAEVAAPPPKVAVAQNVQDVDMHQSSLKKHKRTAIIIGFSTGVFILIIGSLLCFVTTVKKQRNQKEQTETAIPIIERDAVATAEVAAAIQMEQENELKEKVKRMQGMKVAKGGNLIFCAGEAQLYTLDQLMRASAELLGRGTMGITYKAVLDNRLILTVKRLDAGRLASTSKEMFEQHMESVGGLRHPNLVPLRAYFQAHEERLLIYDYEPNGSLFSLIHGSKSTRARPLHWTSCLKIAEDVAQGLAYIHQAWRLVHGNLKSSNVLLGPDFEACIADYCLTALTPFPHEDDTYTAAYKAPELARISDRQETSKSDVYAFGILLLELLTGKPPSERPFSAPEEVANWVRSSREENEGKMESQGMLVEVAIACCLNSPEQRPTMWQVLKMLQEIKETVLTEAGELDPHSLMS